MNCFNSLFLCGRIWNMNKIQSMFKMKCPRCRKGDLFVKPFNMSAPLKMHEHCSVCNQKTEPEPGYYFGAMFISYIWTGTLCLLTVGVTLIFLGWSITQSFTLLIAAFILTFFWVMRVSRSIYINVDIRYDPSKIIRTEADN